MTKMHKNEVDIDEALVHTLLKEQCPHWDNLPLEAILSSGTDNALFRLGSDYVIRLPRIDWATKSIHKEYEWIPKIAQYLHLPISVPLFKGDPCQSYPWSWLITQWNDGHNPSFEKKDEYELLAKELADFLNELHEIKLADGPLSRRGVPLKELNEDTRQAISELEGEINIQSVTSLWHRLSNSPAWHQAPVWIHGDFLPGNILVENNRLTAVIDFSDVGIGDPACDLVIAWSLLNSHSRNVFRKNLKNIDDNTWERGRGWALSIALIMLPYYKNSNPVLASLARRMIENVVDN
ncbi:aminoglycoside phosphotransferase family protein [Legionella tunisiensis]|uniref:aminoglycoside phosphotransferase family protein n=1 Tax=Legionella tunisiensis TaxID=1034944 RepID=UPI0002E8D453|nr:aminoglycoside phosphotransferase family protein [Legionella tunisiensis]